MIQGRSHAFRRRRGHDVRRAERFTPSGQANIKRSLANLLSRIERAHYIKTCLHVVFRYHDKPLKSYGRHSDIVSCNLVANLGREVNLGLDPQLPRSDSAVTLADT